MRLIAYRPFWFIFSLTIILLSLFCLSDYTMLGFIGLCLWLYRLYQTKKTVLFWGSLLCLCLYFPLFYHAQQQFNQAMWEQERNVVITPHWSTVQYHDNGYSVEATWKHQSVYVFIQSKQSPCYTKGLSGKALITNGEQQRVPYGFNQRRWLYSHHLTLAMTMKNPETTSVSFPILWRWQWRCFCYLSTFPHWIQTYGKVLCFGGTFADEEGKSAYAKLGLMHLFCLSGLHIAFVHAILRYVLLRLHCQRHRVIYIEAVVFIFLYVWTNGGIGIFRSSVMQLYHDVLEEREGKSNSYDAWGLALLLQLLWQPALLITSSGILSYAMSFFAFSLPCRTSQRWKHMMLYTVWTLPFLVYFFKQVHLLTPILNLILLPIFSVVVLPILAITLLCPLPIWVNSVEVVFQSWQGIITKLNQFQALPLAPLNIGCLLVYMMLLLCLYRGGRMRCLTIGVLCLFVLNQWHPWGQITMIDVGQGDSLFIRAPGAYHRACLIDCGGKVWSPSKIANATYTLIPFLKGQGVYELEHFFITHADDDHMGDMVEVAKAVRIRHLYFSQGCENKKSFQRRLAQIKQLQPHIKVHPLLAPKQWQWHGITWQLLSPTEAGQGDNNHSLVFKISTPKRSFLLTGDLEKEGEQALMQHRIGPIDVLKVGHHGSKTATSQAWLEALQPKQAWVSCGKHNRFHHPHDEVIQRLNRAHIPIYRTDQFGTIHYYFIGKLEKWVPTHAKNLIIEKTSTS